MSAIPPTIPPTTALADVLALRGETGVLDRSRLHPIHAPTHAVAGGARTIRIEPGAGSLAALYELLSGPLSDEVVMVAAAGLTGAIWGEILSTAARQGGALAVVVDGPTRDHDAVVGSGLWAWGGPGQTVGPAGQAHVTGVDVPVAVGDVTIRPGDLVVLDGDGVVVLAPGSAALADAVAYAEAEEAVMADLRAGVPLRDAYRHKARAVDHIRRSRPSDSATAP